ncbi:copper amine oxidase [Lophiostoma macrostomum CBS 122681]|uniref:Amine oxidase n=1 Tax=Lophiostoma macrostomum CBS 122681 TaxID=1314788 RepID=A0A6A6SPW4_9PLEO|nr:copper amine oxidase [Lophiostoma macrostomum CBS 122681]
MASQPHPFDPLSPEEIAGIANVVRTSYASADPLFRVITLAEPPKAEMIKYLEREAAGDVQRPPKRVAKIHAYISNAFHELKVDVNSKSILSDVVLKGRHSHVDSAYMKQVEEACLRDDRVKGALESLVLPKGATVIVEPWTYATDGMNDMSSRITMCWSYMRFSDHLDTNYYAYPLEIVAEVSESLEVIKIYRLPTGASDREEDTSGNNAKMYDQRKVHSSSEYHPDLNTQRRSTTKPLNIVQPEGPSFAINGNKIEWEKWTMRVGFNYREGLTLHDIRYDNRSLFYRISLSEMFVPYGDPRAPYPRKGAFDLGNDGAGVNANNLKLGCDCLGHIKYFDAWHVISSGDPLKLPNVVCCHEQDDGILWKHTNFRTGNAVVTRSRLLVLQTIITVSNYEYIFLFYFSQDASIHYEVRATGILSTAPIDIGSNVPFGTVVAPGVLAPYHQHLFCLRMDPAIDGHKNSLVVEESVAMPFDTTATTVSEKHAAKSNPFGVGYTSTSTTVSHETGLDLDHTKNRTFKIINESSINSTTGTPVGYKLLPCYSQMLLAHPESYHAKRSEFGEHAVWVTRYEDEEIFAAGNHTLQSLGGEGIASWIKKRAEKEGNSGVKDKDIVVWHTFGSTHNPRIEDWPVMPAEKMIVGLKPVNFLDRNPALDVEISSQHVNRSVLVGEKEPKIVDKEKEKARL